MSIRYSSLQGTRADATVASLGRWVFGKIWIGCVLSGAYALGQHFGWPEAMLSAAALLGAVVLALAANWLPIWTRNGPTGILLVDVSIRVFVWTGLTFGVVALLIGSPAVGAVAGALLLATAWRTIRYQSTGDGPQARRRLVAASRNAITAVVPADTRPPCSCSVVLDAATNRGTHAAAALAGGTGAGVR